ncbi:MAG: class I SAM-dependent methyltransferase [Thermodesulfobacteriota bacterium]
MGEQTPEIFGLLISSGDKVPIVVKYATKYSLWLRFVNAANSTVAKKTFSKLILNFEDEEIELGSGMLSPEPNIDGYSDRLIFTQDLYFLDRLFQKRQVATLQENLVNLPLILAHKNEVKPAFKEYTSGLTYDLSVYRHVYNSLDAEYQNEPPEVKGFIQNTIIETEGRKFFKYLDGRLNELENMVRGFTKEEHERHGYYFRRQLWEMILTSPFMSRTNLKPRGYSGDSEMMRMIYTKEYQGDTIFGRLLHKHPLDHPAAQAVRNRRMMISHTLDEYSRNNDLPAGERIKVLSVACGPAYEVNDLIHNEEDAGKFHFALLDQDRQALNQAANQIFAKQAELKTRISVSYLNDSVRTLLGTPQLKSRWGQFNFIYSMGLFDYLTPPVAAAVLEKLYHLLTPGGEMIIGNFHVGNPSRYYMEYWLDWVLFYREEEDLYNLMKKNWSAEARVFFEETRSQMFMDIKKRSEGG